MKDALVFSHANGFPAPVYRVLFDALGERFDVSAVDRFGHDQRYPVGRGWPGLVAQLRHHIESAVAPGRRTWLVGHSMGGYLSVQAAATLGSRIAGVVLLDSPLIGGLGARVVKLGRLTGLDQHLMPLEQTRQRRTRWPDVDSVRAHFADKPGFRRWDPRVLHDYAKHGTEARDGERALRFDREVEYRIYRTLPTRSIAELARGLPLPMGFVGGRYSREVRHIGLRHTRRVVGDRLDWIDGSHLFPMERPVETVLAIESLVDRMRCGNCHDNDVSPVEFERRYAKSGR
mgnify:CR=1 FL=1